MTQISSHAQASHAGPHRLEPSSSTAHLREVIEHELTDKQRQILILMVFHEVPMDEIVRRFGTNRNAVYKMLHDARRKLKNSLQTRGFEVDDILALFSTQR